jgi:hypothetical protein
MTLFKRSNNLFTSFLFGLVVFHLATKNTAAEIESDPPVQFKSGGYVYLENFRFGQADYGSRKYKSDWFTGVLAGLVLENQIGDLKSLVSIEASQSRSFPESQSQLSSKLTRFDTYVQEAKGYYPMIKFGKNLIETEVGLFLYDYNKSNHNLGDYLFRSPAYPGVLSSNFDLPKERILGFRIGHSYSDLFSHDLILTSEYKFYPHSDFSLSYLAKMNVGKILEVGGGVSLHHLIPVRPSATTPKNDGNTVIEYSYTHIAPKYKPILDGGGLIIDSTFVGFDTLFLTNTHMKNQKNRIPDSLKVDGELNPNIPRKETAYSFQGTKLVGFFSLDIKRAFGEPQIFGENDLKFYGEVAVLGYKNYPILYENRLQRMPVTLGFNFPAFKFLDKLSLEVEYYGSRHPNNYARSVSQAVPQPGNVNFDITSWDESQSGSNSIYAEDDWKWSIYLHKQILRGLTLSAQVASDHLRKPDAGGYVWESLMKDTGIPFTDDWWGILRLTISY